MVSGRSRPLTSSSSPVITAPRWPLQATIRSTDLITVASSSAVTGRASCRSAKPAARSPVENTETSVQPRARSAASATLAYAPVPMISTRLRGERAVGGLGDVQRDGGHRPPGGPQIGAGLDLLGGPRRTLEQQVQRRRHRAGELRCTERPAHLTGDLSLADDHRIEAGGDGEQMRRDGRADPHLERRRDRLPAQTSRLGQGCGDGVDAIVEQPDIQVHLDPVAGREHHDAFDRSRLRGGEAKCDPVRQLLGAGGQGLESGQLQVVVGGTEQDEHPMDATHRNRPAPLRMA